MIINKVAKHYLGALDFISRDIFKNKTIPTLKKLEKSTTSTTDLVDALLNSKIVQVNVVFTETSESWNPM